jgi:hypothetical protein
LRQASGSAGGSRQRRRQASASAEGSGDAGDRLCDRRQVVQEGHGDAVDKRQQLQEGRGDVGDMLCDRR